jgi:hypothetical protein
MVCHAPSQSKDDLVRGLVPIPGTEPSPQYYQATTGTFVRADITFVRQDFSVVQPVGNSLKWPGNQRFDYLLRTRNATTAENKLYKQLQTDSKLLGTYPQKEALLYALGQIATAHPQAIPAEAIPLLKGLRETPLLNVPDNKEKKK